MAASVSGALGAFIRIWPRSSAPHASSRAAPAAFVASGPTCAPFAQTLPSSRACAEATTLLAQPSNLPEPWPRACAWPGASLDRVGALPGTGAATGARHGASSPSPLERERSRAPTSRRMASLSEAKRVAASLPCPPEYRANVGICLVNKSGLVFVASRIDKPGSWQMPQGGIDAGEEPEAAARRELREETGVVSADLIAEVPDWLCYDFPPDVRAKLAVAWGKDWKGQAQKWFLFRYTGADDSEVCLAGDGSEKPEFDAWKWTEAASAIEAAVDFKRPVYEAAFKFFEPYLHQ